MRRRLTFGRSGSTVRAVRLTNASTPQLVTEDYFEAAWSPDGRRILFERIQVPEPTGLG